MKLLEAIPRIKVTNYFLAIGLRLQLQSKEMKILTTATIKMDRIQGCPLDAEKDLKKGGRGSSCYMVDLNSCITILRWFDNKCVQVATIYTDPTYMQTFQRWDRASKKHIQM